ncbi:hypothetical protein [Nonomuraea sp. NPDC050786]|uniref:hypothetical protein n=1 Tax=Nonomuraea sp. NPDC050786 TaxID=3154840 RepID=UPI0033D5C56A
MTDVVERAYEPWDHGLRNRGPVVIDENDLASLADLAVIISGKELDVWLLSGGYWVIGGVSTVVAYACGVVV